MNISKRSMLKLGVASSIGFMVPEIIASPRVHRSGKNDQDSDINTSDLTEVVKLATSQCIQAYCGGTFAVGGVLMNIANGDIIHAIHNSVVQEGITYDPTAHGERQMVDWYFAQRKAGVNLPPVEELVVITTLDPCLMCTGSLVSAGFKTIISAYDDFAGINYNLKADFPSVTRPEVLKASFSYPEVAGHSCMSRTASGAALPAIFTQQVLDEYIQLANRTSFEATLEKVRNIVGSHVEPNPEYNMAKLPESHPIKLKLRKVFNDSLKLTLVQPGRPDMTIAPYIRAAQEEDRQQGGNGDVTAIFDYFGNMLFCLAGRLADSPILTPWMRCTREYNRIRYECLQEKIADAEKYLVSLRYGMILMLRCPNDSFRDLADIGAYGSTMEGPLPELAWNNLQYIQSSTLVDINTYLQGMPPLYRDLIKVQMWPVKDTELVGAFDQVPPPEK